jgi:hypothetical protein
VTLKDFLTVFDAKFDIGEGVEHIRKRYERARNFALCVHFLPCFSINKNQAFTSNFRLWKTAYNAFDKHVQSDITFKFLMAVNM